MKLYVIRHGETEWNTEKRMQGWGNSNLTQLGATQAISLGKAISPIYFKKAYCSPLGRAVDTAKHIIGNRKIDLVENENFKEMGFGCWEGVAPEKLKSKYPKEYENFWEKPQLYSPIDGETFLEVQNRILRGINQIVDAEKDGNILLVTHAMVIKILLLHIKKLPLKELWNSSFIHGTSLTIVEVKQGSMEIITEGDISHISN